MSKERKYKVCVIVNPDTPHSWERTLMPWATSPEAAISKVEKFGRVKSCVKLDTESFIGKIKFINTEKGEPVIHDRDTLSEAIAFNSRVVIEDGFILGKSMRLIKLERDSKDKKSLDEILDEDEE